MVLYLCVRGIDLLPFIRFVYWILEMFRLQCSIFLFAGFLILLEIRASGINDNVDHVSL